MKLVARFWNEDGIEMPALYRNEAGELICTWNYLFLVAPHLTGSPDCICEWRGDKRAGAHANCPVHGLDEDIDRASNEGMQEPL